jgi:CheY-like chemotaxis protein
MISLGSVLVVDDERAAFEAYQDLLTREGYRVEWAPDQASALKKMDEQTWDVVILDQHLKNPTGGDKGINIIRDIVPTGAKVIVATAYADDLMIERAFRDGAYDYLEKTQRLPTLLRIKVRNAVEAVQANRIADMSADEREAAIREGWQAVQTETDKHRKGKLLEDLMVLLFKTIPGFKNGGTRRRSQEEEIDLFIRNESQDPFWARDQSQYVIVECKNWSGPVGAPEFSSFKEKIQNRFDRCRLGFFVAVGGFTKGFDWKTQKNPALSTLVVAVGPEDIQELVSTRDRNEVLKRLHSRTVMPGNGH